MSVTLKTYSPISVFLFAVAVGALAQSTKLPVLPASTWNATIDDGEHVRLKWDCDPKADPDIYYVNLPRKATKVTFHSDKGELSFTTRYGMHNDFLMVNEAKESCKVRIAAEYDKKTVYSPQSGTPTPHAIPFVLKGSRVYLSGILNHDHTVTIQLDLGAGTNAVSKAVSKNLALTFDGTTTLSNTLGVAEARTSLRNSLQIGTLEWSELPFVEAGNMQPGEDLLIGNGLFRDKVLELDYDRNVLTVYDKLPKKARAYSVQPVFFEQNRPKFEVGFIQDHHPFDFWFVFDTGRDGTMLIGDDFTGQHDNWSKLKEFQIANGRKIVRLDAIIGGQTITDIVTNAADPAKPGGRPSLFGNQILNHFNVILDNRTGLLYLKPNSRTNQAYSHYEPDTKPARP